MNRRKLIKGIAAAAAASGVSVSTVAADTGNEKSHSTAVLSSATPTNGNRVAIVRAAKGGVEFVVKQNKNKETVLDIGGQTPLHPAWNEQGNRLVVSLNGNIWMYEPRGEFVQVTDSGRDIFAQFDGEDIVFFRGDSTKQISHTQLRKVAAGQYGPADVAIDDTPFKLSYATKHPAVDENLAAEIRNYVANAEES